MRLDLNTLKVDTFSTGPTPTPVEPDTGPQGPDSLCYICYETGNTVPTCEHTCANSCTYYYPCPLPDTYFAPCTNQLTCVGCA